MAVDMHRRLTVDVATPESTRAFGTLIGAGPGPGVPSRYYERSSNYQFDFISDDDTTLIVSACQPRALEVRYMERHFKHTQTFIPLAGKPFAMLVAPPSTDELPDLSLARALVFDGSAGFMLHIGTWHEFPFALRRDTNLVSVLRHETYRGVGAVQDEQGEAHNPDLDKKDIVVRLGVVIEIDFPRPWSEQDLTPLDVAD